MAYHFKESVDCRGIRTEILLAIQVADQCNPLSETWINSISDDAFGRKENSLHKSGLAVDIDISGRMSEALGKKWAKDIQFILPKYYQVIFEVDHIHIEFDAPIPPSEISS